MSDKERPSGGGGGGKDGEGGGGPTEKIDLKERKCESCGRKGKMVSLFRFGKGKKLLQERRKHRGSSVNSGRWAKRGGGGCFFCLKQPRAMESSGESPTSDTTSAEIDYDVLKVLIEKNDFYSKDCNPHLDRDG
ncbi:uncharacterized protein Fot_46705 [Forsythia ovata]|uniref:Uncharacterized protein n=1 Tax=Forsythia ovata TaxID=205694 RepID=A0ABD1QNU7_9LAMI